MFPSDDATTTFGFYDMCGIEVAKTVAVSIASTPLDYCNALFFGMSAANFSKLQRIQNTLARVVLRKRKLEHITPSLKELHWIPVQQRV